jgi:hypothetical protein
MIRLDFTGEKYYIIHNGERKEADPAHVELWTILQSVKRDLLHIRETVCKK